MGRLLQVGTPEDLYHAPVSREVAAFIGRGTILPALDNGDKASVTIGSRTQRDSGRSRAEGPRRDSSTRMSCFGRMRWSWWAAVTNGHGRAASSTGDSRAER